MHFLLINSTNVSLQLGSAWAPGGWSRWTKTRRSEYKIF